MALPADLVTRGTGDAGSDVSNLVAQFNVMVAQLRVLTAKLDLDAGVTDTNYAALVSDSAVGPAKVTTIYG